MLSKKRAFTLIEVLVVVLIIGILAAVAVPQYQKAVAKARTTDIILFVNAFEKALALEVLRHGIQETDGYFFHAIYREGECSIQDTEAFDIDFKPLLKKNCEWLEDTSALAIERPDGKIHYELLNEGNPSFSIYVDSTDGFTWTRSCGSSSTLGTYICQALESTGEWN